MSRYNLRSVSQSHFQMAKFDDDLNVEAVYNLIAKGPGFSCDCPASARVVKYKPCKHQRMIGLMMGAVNTERFYDPDTRTWAEPLAHLRNGDRDGLPMTLETGPEITATEINQRMAEAN